MNRFHSSLSRCRPGSVPVVVVVAIIMARASTLHAQTTATVPGMAGTLAPDDTVIRETDAVWTAVGDSIAGVGRLVHVTARLFHAQTPGAIDPLADLLEGTTVVVDTTDHPSAADVDVAEPDDVEAVTEGTVVRLDRHRHQVAIRFDDHSIATYTVVVRSVTGHPAQVAPGSDGRAREGERLVRLSYRGESGRVFLYAVSSSTDATRSAN